MGLENFPGKKLAQAAAIAAGVSGAGTEAAKAQQQVTLKGPEIQQVTQSPQQVEVNLQKPRTFEVNVNDKKVGVQIPGIKKEKVNLQAPEVKNVDLKVEKKEVGPPTR